MRHAGRAAFGAAFLLLGGWAVSQGDRAAQAEALIAQAKAHLRDGLDALALPLLEEAERLAEDAPIVEVHLGQAFKEAGASRQAAAAFMRAAFVEDNPLAAAAALHELSGFAQTLRLPQCYAGLMASGLHEEAVREAPWWPAAYWALGLRAQIDGRRDEALRRLRQFQLAMSATGLDRPYRDLVIEAAHMRDQVRTVEAQFLADAGFLPSNWRQRTHGEDLAAAFGAVDAEIWGAAGEAMRHTLRYKTLRVAPGQRGAHSSIQAAVDSLMRSGGGGAVEIEPGVYHESVVLREAARVVLRASETGAVRVVSAGPALKILGGINIVVDGIRFETSGGIVAAEIAGAKLATLRRSSLSGGSSAALHAHDVYDLYLANKNLLS